MLQTTISAHHHPRCAVKTVARPILLLVMAAVVAALTFVAPAEAASINTRFDICAELRNGASLASIEAALEARGYSPTRAGALTGRTIRRLCPDQAANAIAQVQRAGI
jgi:hypothetical protein